MTEQERFIPETSQTSDAELEYVDETESQVVWRTSGKVRNVAHVSVESGSSILHMTKPVETRFVGVRSEEDVRLEVFNPEIHGEWERIPDTKLTPAEIAELDEDYEGGIELGQIINERKKRASQTKWNPHNKSKTNITKKA